VLTIALDEAMTISMISEFHKSLSNVSSFSDEYVMRLEIIKALKEAGDTFAIFFLYLILTFGITKRNSGSLKIGKMLGIPFYLNRFSIAVFTESGIVVRFSYIREINILPYCFGERFSPPTRRIDFMPGTYESMRDL